MAGSGSEPSLSDLVKSINDTAQTARNVLTAMLVVAVSLTATVIATTDLALLRDSADVLPSLGVRLPVTVMYALAPPVFVFLHVNALLQLHLLAGRLAVFEDELKALTVETDRRRWRQLLHGFAFVQLHAGAESRAATSGSEALPARFVSDLGRMLLRFVVMVSIYGVPILLLLAAQISFMRYQSWEVTGVQIAGLVVDVVLILWFRLSLRLQSRGLGRWRHLATAGDVFLVLIVLLIASHAVPPSPDLRDLEVRWRAEDGKAIGAWGDIVFPVASYDANFFDRVTCGVAGVACRYLRLARRTLINEDAKPGLLGDLGLEAEMLRKVKADIITLSLRERSLRFADLLDSRFFAVDLTGADLRGANLVNARLQGANLFQAQLQGANLTDAQLPGAELRRALLQGATLKNAQLQGANFSEARLQGAILFQAGLQGANFANARLQGANFHQADLQVANFFQAQLQGASLADTQLQGAVLQRALLRGADLSNARIHSATGGELECSLLRTANVSFGPWNDADAEIAFAEVAMSESSTPAQVRQWVSLHLKRAQAKVYVPTTCTDGSHLQNARDPSSESHVQYLRSLACQDTDVVRGMLSATLPFRLRQGIFSDRNLVAYLSALSDSGGPDCPGPAKLPSGTRDMMIKHLMALQVRTEKMYFNGR